MQFAAQDMQFGDERGCVFGPFGANWMERLIDDNATMS